MTEIRINFNVPQIKEKVTSDKMGLFINVNWKRLIDPWTPRDTGGLMEDVSLDEPFKIRYKKVYASYQYRGEKYVDPVYNVGGFYSPRIGWFSRPNVAKIPSGKPLIYNRKNPYSTSQWDVKAAQSGQRDKLYRTINSALRNNSI